MLCRVLLLDSSVREWNLPSNAIGQELFDKVCEHLDLLERDYFGLAIFHSPNIKTWLDVSKQINKQLKRIHAQFVFSVKFYPPNPAQLSEDLTRYLLYLQLRRDLLTRRLPCPSVTLIALGSFVLQSEFGQYDPDLHGNTYTNNLYLAPNQNEELLKRMKEQHLTYGSMSPAEADLLFLQNACQLPMYGIDRHPAKDSDGEDIVLGVCSEGILMYRDDMVESKFLWPRILKLSYKHSKLLLRIHPSEDSVWTLCFTLPSNHACKVLWKVAVEHHSFFRLPSVEVPRRRLLTSRSQFRYYGRTEAESIQASSEITRPSPAFSRKLRKKSTSLDALTCINQPVSHDWFLILDSVPPKPLSITGLNEGPVLVRDYKVEPDDWLLYLDPTRTTQMPLDWPQTDTGTFPEDLDQGHEDTSADGVGGGVQGEGTREELAEEEEVMEEEKEERHQEGEVWEIRQMKEVKIVRKISREVKTVGHTFKESKDLEILEEGDERGSYESGIQKDKRPLDQHQELVARIMGEKLEGLEISVEQEQEWEVVEDPQEQTVEEGEEEGETVEIRHQKLKIVRKQMQEVRKDELPLKDIIVDEMQLEIGVIQEQVRELLVVEETMQEVNVGKEELHLKDIIVDEMQLEIGVIQEQVRELLVVEETQMELETLEEKLQDVDVLEYKIQKMEQQWNEDTLEDDWFILLDQPPYMIYPAPLEQTSRTVEEKQTLEMPVDHGTEETVLTGEEQSEEQVVITESMEESAFVAERGVITEPIALQYNFYPVPDTVDDWYLLLEPVPLEDRGTVGSVEPYTAEYTYLSEEERTLEKEEMEPFVIPEQMVQVPEEPTTISETTTAQIILQKTDLVLRVIEDDWFMHFDHVPVQAKTPHPVVWESLKRSTDVNTISREMKVEELRDEERMEESTETQEQKMVAMYEAQPTVQEQRPPSVPRVVEDDWYILLEAYPKETVRAVEPYKEETRQEVEVYQSEEETSFEIKTVITETMTTQVTITEERKERQVTIMEEQNIYAENPGDYITLDVKCPVAARDIEDWKLEDWFIVLESVPVEAKPSSPVAWERERVPQAEEPRGEERMVKMEQRTEGPEHMMAGVEEVQLVIQEQRLRFTEREVEDDWYTLLEVPPRETVWVSPQLDEDTLVKERLEVKRVRISEEKVEIISEREELTLKVWPTVAIQNPPVVPRDIEDDWFGLFEKVPVEVQTQPSVWVSPQYDEDTLVKERLKVKRVRISEEKVEIISEREELTQKPTVAVQNPPVVPRDIEDDWFQLFERVPMKIQTQPSVAWEKLQAPPDVSRMTMEIRAEGAEERRRAEEMRERQEQLVEMRGVRPAIQEQRPKIAPRVVDDDWYTLLEVSPKETAEVKVDMTKGVRWEERITKPATVTEEKRIITEKPIEQLLPLKQLPVPVRHIDDDWFMLLDPVPLQQRSAPPAATKRPVDVSRTKDQRVAEKARPEKERIRVKERPSEEEVQRMPQLSTHVGVREIEDDWFILSDKAIPVYRAETRAAVVSKPEEQRAMERDAMEKRLLVRERRKGEDIRKRVTIAEAKRVSMSQAIGPAAIRNIVDDWYILLDKVSVEDEARHRVAPIIPPTPAKKPVPVEQPLTSTPTIHPAPIIKYIPKEEKRETRITVEEKVKGKEELTIIKRKTRKIEGENIYIRHSILMLEDFDVTQEVVLRHHASISNLKRLFMEAEPEPYVTEWDKHLSICHLDTHTHLISMEEWERDERESIM